MKNSMPITGFESSQHAAKHPICADRPSPGFFEGALLGNGGMGVVVCTRPDAVVLHFGHNAVWDVRLAENNREKIGTFQEVFEKVQAIPSEYRSLSEDAWYRQYYVMTEENYSKPYPRPFPCGSVVLGFDRREAELLGHRLDIASGLCEVFFLVGNTRPVLQLFTNMTKDRLWLRMVDEQGDATAAPLNRVHLLPDPETPAEFPRFTIPESLPAGTLAFRQTLPSQESAKAHPKDRAFRLTARWSASLRQGNHAGGDGHRHPMGEFERELERAPGFVGCIQLDHGPDSALPDEPVPEPAARTFLADSAVSEKSWREYWGKSGVALDDELLERTWYHNLYFLNCSAREGVVCPGLFANWSYGQIGSAWHGDYHMNYNTQQPFWGTFSSNHVDKHLPYVDLVDHLLPISRQWARDYYGLRGAFFPHSAYPVEMTMMPYPVPTWGWEICETPWTVQSLWWHYLYTMDKAFLRDRAWEPIREAVLFLVDYMRRPEAHGPQWGDENYHIFPTVPPELYGLQPGFRNNHDCLVDLTLGKFVLKAYLESCRILEIEAEEMELMLQVRDVLEHFPEYPTADSGRGKVFVSVEGEDPEIVYNAPNSLMTVFPGEDHGLHSPPGEYQIAANSYRNHRNEGGNELVFRNLAGARLGLLDLEAFKRQIHYCLLPNGTCTDRLLEVNGRYTDASDFDFMAPMGIWFENFALPVVINECLMQSYNGQIRLFPNWPADKAAEFFSLRAVGGFLVSAVFSEGAVRKAEILSEAGSPLRLVSPWKDGATCTSASGTSRVCGDLIELPTRPGEIIGFSPPQGGFPA
jgi:hypothetical protein